MKRLLLNIRGTSGSGKTTLVRRFMEEYGVEHIPKHGKKGTADSFPGAAKVVIPGWNNPIHFIGKYASDGCGGLDTVYSQADSIKWALTYLDYGHVICEGLLTSGLGPGGVFCRVGMQFAPQNIRFLFLDTSLEQCIENVNKRRREQGNNEVFTDDKGHLTKKHMQIQNVIRTMHANNYPVSMLDHTRAYDQVKSILLEAEYDSGEASS